jgi:hypothetical protein
LPFYGINVCVTLSEFLLFNRLSIVEKGTGVYRVLVGRPEGKRPLGKPRRRWEDNIKTHLRE